MTLEQQYTNGITNTEFAGFVANPNFGAFFSEKIVSVPPNGNIFIEDISALEAMDFKYQKLAAENQRELIVFKAEELTAHLATQLDQIPKSFGFVFPGNGSRIIQAIMQQSFPEILKNRPTMAVKTKRSRENGVWSISVDVPDLDDTMRKCTDWVIVDDVVLSGQTAAALKQGITDKTERTTDSWTLATWLALDPKRRKKITKTNSASSVDGFDAVSAVVTYKGGNGIPPCNSLSTLLLPDEKGEAVREKLASAYFPAGFEQFIQQLSHGTN